MENTSNQRFNKIINVFRSTVCHFIELVIASRSKQSVYNEFRLNCVYLFASVGPVSASISTKRNKDPIVVEQAECQPNIVGIETEENTPIQTPMAI